MSDKDSQQLFGEELEELEKELAEFDLLDKPSEDSQDTADAQAASDASPGGEFDEQKEKKEKKLDAAELKARDAARLRQRLLLEALMNVRLALVDVTRINLGDRFSFTLVPDDYNGWPRLTAKLFDQILENEEYPTLQVGLQRHLSCLVPSGLDHDR